MQLLLLFTALAGFTPFAQGLSSTVNKQCFTRYGTKKPSSIKTVQFASTNTRTATKVVTITPKSIITPNAITSTVTSSSTSTSTTTAPTSTDTYTTTKTIVSINTSTEVEKYTQLVTSTSTTTMQSTTTIAPPVGFTALADTLGYHAKRNAVVEKREALLERGNANAFIPIIPEAKPTAPALMERQAGGVSQFPVAVSCTAKTTYFLTQTLSSTALTTVTLTLPTQTAFTTTTVPVTEVKTVIPASATTIITIPTTSWTVTTTTERTTSTNTQVDTLKVPIATYLAQCSSQNIVGSAVGQKIGTISFNPAFTLQSLYPADTSGYGCCAICANAPNCAGYAQAPNGGACYYILTDGRCDMAQSFGDRYHYYNTNGNGYLVGNAQCGFLGPKAGVN